MANYSELSDQELTALLKADDHGAFTEIYHRYQASTYVFTYRRMRDREAAKDIVHELFLKVWTMRQELKIKSTLAGYLYTAAKNSVLKAISHEQVAERYIDSFQHYIDTFSDTTDHLVRHNDLQAIIEAEIAALPPRMKLVFELSRKSDLSRKQIAEQLDISEETVKAQMHVALKTLKIKLGPLFTLLF
ncbi:RNA polymerase sigma-70 factor (ECF subfamily) [Mucilaginibacter gracilis]|uniref:RNA polymerase sigma-70 factor (ECF subfamily) n=1 Tax=Mucilaginibacter gracilis TaxID=423350 RepID=A0A495J1V1_9SPHI|nr:RNA polymerase sigma-70 factor [Mucilaginibacter gracilis]RKR82069.1 RNA polymerase sigma-70 factor (ECF subfamily) [Mucilaginibacter gracilis]